MEPQRLADDELEPIAGAGPGISSQKGPGRETPKAGGGASESSAGSPGGEEPR